ncbi:SIMPL domain-containing protein [Novosphingobium guangzhouense]|uniref:SIMPL domain-containing protein n=1 Tax=Novosphingobium guangzhouense TaxID=1850347 RepID=A0A2K2FU68_9SPHN|nr:SIMPL domain-containing protein [Novosphingobium guangzhouense]PNU02337.1 hypothetical protein A8V01_26565 [Novosphingobium guangzhouense]
MRIVALAILMATPGSTAAAQTVQAPQILVSASGTAKTVPDMATINFTLRGEGATSDEAASKLRDQAAAMSASIKGFLPGAVDFRSSSFSMAQVRSRECDASPYGQQRLSTGACAIIGYIATMPVSVDTSRPKDAGTLVSLIGRSGGLDAAVQRFWLRDDAAARSQAMQAALANAQAKAKLIAQGSGTRLGPVLRVQDADYREVTMEPDIVQAAGSHAVAPPAPPPPPPPVQVELTPRPIETTVRLMVSYSIGN